MLNDLANNYSELGHDHGGSAVICTVARWRPGHYNVVEVRRKGQQGLGCSPRPQTLAKQVGVGTELVVDGDGDDGDVNWRRDGVPTHQLLCRANGKDSGHHSLKGNPK